MALEYLQQLVIQAAGNYTAKPNRPPRELIGYSIGGNIFAACYPCLTPPRFHVFMRDKISAEIEAANVSWFGKRA